MKRVVMDTGLHEADIRPPGLLSEFKRLSLIDAATFFGDSDRLVEVPCPACGGSDHHGAFRCNGFLYQRCVSCDSLFVSPRPDEAALAHYYATSSASRFRVEHFNRRTAEARRVHLLRSHANWIATMVDRRGGPRVHVDLETHAHQIFAELRDQNLFERLISHHPLPGLAEEMEAEGVEVTQTPPTGAGAVTAFEKLENRFSPLEFIRRAGAMLGDRGVLFLTSRTCSGFDLQVLGDKTPYIFVPEHLNLLSVEGISRLIERAGLSLVELSTPGQLDLELTQHAADHDPSIQLPAFVRYLLQNRDQDAHREFQAFLQKHRLSSHVRVAATQLGQEEGR